MRHFTPIDSELWIFAGLDLSLLKRFPSAIRSTSSLAPFRLWRCWLKWGWCNLEHRFNLVCSQLRNWYLLARKVSAWPRMKVSVSESWWRVAYGWVMGSCVEHSDVTCTVSAVVFQFQFHGPISGGHTPRGTATCLESIDVCFEWECGCRGKCHLKASAWRARKRTGGAETYVVSVRLSALLKPDHIKGRLLLRLLMQQRYWQARGQHE